MLMTTPVLLQDRDVFSYTDNAQRQAIGTEGQTADGRKFRYVKAGATTLVVGHLLSAPTHNGSQVGLSVNNALMVVGAQSVTVTPGAAIAANQYQGGKLVVSAGGGQGYEYLLGPHAAGNSTVNIVFQLASTEYIQVSANTLTRVDLCASPYNGVIDNPTAAVAYPVGKAVSPIPNGQFGWVQTHGFGTVLIDGAPAIGVAVMPSDAVAGAVEAAVQTGQAANTATTAVLVGFMAETGVDTKYKGVYLKIE